MKKNVLLIDTDSKIPNLALMKLSSYHKQIGDNVGFNVENPDLVYASCIFTRNKHKTDGLQFFFPNAEINIGGSGINLNCKLPIPEEYGGDLIIPDYSLYPNFDYDIGFTSRGCIRNCYFCIVREKEGKYQRVQHPSEFHDPRHKKATYLDNNILADKEWFFTVTDWLIQENISVDFSQGLDIRLVDEEIAQRIKQVKHFNTIHFAYDDTTYKDKVYNGIELLNNAGVSVRNSTHFYVYINDDNHFEDALERCNTLKKWNTTPYPMINPNAKMTTRLKKLKRWCRPWIFWSCDFDEFVNDNRGY